MHKTVAAIYVRGSNQEEVTAQVATLKSRVRNDGSVLGGKKRIYTDISPSTDGLSALLTDIDCPNFNVIYLSYTFLREADRNVVRQAVRQAYISGKSAIVYRWPVSD